MTVEAAGLFRDRPCALITGAAGQDGTLLTSLLVSKGYEVLGVVRPGTSPPRESRVRFVELDLRDSDELAALVTDARPAEVYNLGGFSSVSRSWSEPREVMETNVLPVMTMLEAVRRLEARGHRVRFYQASSSEMFGAPPRWPQSETTALHPRSPYGVSKAAAHHLTVNYRESYGLFACSGILYNHESALRPPTFVTRKITRGAAAIALGLAERLVLGTLDVCRDWGYAPDYVHAMWLILQGSEPEDYVVASGVSRSLSEFLEVAFTAAGLTDWRRYVSVDPSYQRPAEVANLVGDASKARERLGWQQTRSFEELVAEMVHHDLSSLTAEVQS